MDELIIKYDIFDLVTVNGRISKKLCEKVFVKQLESKDAQIKLLREAFRREDMARFWSKVLVKKSNECWDWNAGVSLNGYGKISIGNHSYSVHVVSYRYFNGDYDKSLWVDHTCRNRKCVNPNHLRVVTPRVNALENSESTSAMNSQKTHCKHGHEFSEENTRMRKSNGQIIRLCKTCYSRQKLELRERKRARLALAELDKIKEGK